MTAPNHANIAADCRALLTHSFLLSNLHCPSCVLHIQESLSRFDLVSVSPSLVTSYVTVEHNGVVPASVIRGALEDAGFDVCHVTPDDGLGKRPSRDSETGYLDRLIEKFDSGKQGGRDTKSGPSRKHLQNCEACRLGLDRDAKHGSSSTNPSPASGASPAMREKADSKSELRVVVEGNEDPLQNVWRASLAIGGMTCASCATAISKELEKKAWIKNVTVNLISNSATVDFIEKEQEGAIVEAIEDIGYDATIDTVVDVKAIENAQASREAASRTVDILVDGMYCDHCPPRILTSLQTFGDQIKVEKALSVNDPVLSISYTPQVPHFTIRNIIKAISDSCAEEDEPFKVSIYHPPTLEELSRLIHQRERLRILIRVLVAFVIAIPTLIIGVVYMSLVPASNPGSRFLMAPLRSGVSRSQWALFILATPVYFLCADVFHVRALKEIRAMWRPGSTTPILQRFYRFGSMNMLMSLGTSIAYISSVAQLIAAGVHPPSMPVNNSFYFDSVVFLTLFLLIGRLIEAYSKSKTGDAVMMLGKLRPAEALLVVNPSEGEDSQNVSVDLLEYGDNVKVLHGASPPCDGTILQGETKFDESSLTGESKLISKSIGDEVFSGTVNKDSPVTVNITGVAGSSMIDQIVKAVREGQTRRAPMERIADTLTSYFVPFVTLIAIGTWIIWLALGYSGTLPQDYLGEDAPSWVTWSLQFAIAVFVVACPCGLALAAPTALFVGGGLAAQHGILVKGGGEAFEKASRLDCIVFDKTGTLTVGEQPAVTDTLPIKVNINLGSLSAMDLEKMILAMVGAIEGNSSHTIAQALRSYCKEQRIEGIQFETANVEEIPGKGMRGSFGVVKTSSEPAAVDMIIGNEGFMMDSQVLITADTQMVLDNWKSKGNSVVLVAISVDHPVDSDTSNLADRAWCLAAIFAVTDPIRPESPQIIAQLKKRGLQVWMLSGDNQITANAIGAQVGIPAENIIASVLPNEKADRIRYLQKSLKSGSGLESGVEHSQKRAVVAMVGDGINDSPALTTADVGIAIGSGSDIAISAAEFVLVSSNLNTLITLLDLSVVVFRRIKINFAWALVYNLIALPVAAGVLYPVMSNGRHVRLDPVWASLAMAASSISVVCSSLALRSKIPWVGFKARQEGDE